MKDRLSFGPMTQVLRTVLVAACLSCLLGSPSQVQAGATVFSSHDEIIFEDFLVPNYCTGEVINERGTIDIHLRAVQNPAGGLTYQFHYVFKATGLGDQGNQYIINQQAKEKAIFAPSGTFVYSMSDDFVQISKGSGENSRFHFTYRLVLSADGKLVFEILDMRLDCVNSRPVEEAAPTGESAPAEQSVAAQDPGLAEPQ